MNLSRFFLNLTLIYRMMVLGSWIFTIICSSPQAIIFRVLKHPTKEFYQCTTINFFEDLSDEVVTTSPDGGNSTHLYLLGLGPESWNRLYHVLFNCEIFFIPLIIILISYAKIYSILDM